MTALQAYEAVLIELNKVGAPSLLLRDFNYDINKAINNYLNKRYNIYDVNQQTTDDLSRLKTSGVFTVNKTRMPIDGELDEYTQFLDSEATYEAILPSDYFHILNCICLYQAKREDKCINPGKFIKAQATRLTADLYPQIIDNYWNMPSYKRPYYYIHNVNTSEINPTNKIYSVTSPGGTDEFIQKKEKDNAYRNIGTDIDAGNPELICYYKNNVGEELSIEPNDFDGFLKSEDGLLAKFGDYIYNIDKGVLQNRPSGYPNDRISKVVYNPTKMPTTIILGKHHHSNIEREAGNRYGNVSEVRLEIRYGDDSTYELKKVLVDYLKTPQYVELTQEQLDTVEDTSQMLEFPDYVCQEIINELVHIIMENNSDPRLQTHPVVTQSIANPVQQQTAQPAVSTAQ